MCTITRAPSRLIETVPAAISVGQRFAQTRSVPIEVGAGFVALVAFRWAVELQRALAGVDRDADESSPARSGRADPG